MVKTPILGNMKAPSDTLLYPIYFVCVFVVVMVGIVMITPSSSSAPPNVLAAQSACARQTLAKEAKVVTYGDMRAAETFCANAKIIRAQHDAVAPHG